LFLPRYPPTSWSQRWCYFPIRRTKGCIGTWLRPYYRSGAVECQERKICTLLIFAFSPARLGTRV
jgi:hypothetical protein